MAVSVKVVSKDLILTFVKVNDLGKTVNETRRVRNFKVGAQPEDLHEVALMIAGLSEQTCDMVAMQDVSELSA